MRIAIKAMDLLPGEMGGAGDYLYNLVHSLARVDEQNEYLILLDFKRNKGADRYTMLRRVLDRSLRGKAWVTDLTVIDSHQSP